MSAQLAFLSSTGEPVALCILRVENAEEHSLGVLTMEGMSATSWKKDGYEYFLIRGQDQSLFEPMAVNIASGRI